MSYRQQCFSNKLSFVYFPSFGRRSKNCQKRTFSCHFLPFASPAIYVYSKSSRWTSVAFDADSDRFFPPNICKSEPSPKWWILVSHYWFLVYYHSPFFLLGVSWQLWSGLHCCSPNLPTLPRPLCPNPSLELAFLDKHACWAVRMSC